MSPEEGQKKMSHGFFLAFLLLQERQGVIWATAAQTRGCWSLVVQPHNHRHTHSM
jgi:hypothetical protein